MVKLYRSSKAQQGILTTYAALVSAWGIQTERLMLKTRYGLTHVIAAGDAALPPLVLLHGVGDDAALMWVYNAGALSAHFRIYAVDTIGGPGCSRPDARYNAAFDDVLWLDDVLAALKLQQAFFAGVSHGGYLVQLYTLARTERVLRACAIASSVPDAQSGDSPMKTMMRIFLPEALFPTEQNTQRLIRKLSGAHADVFLRSPLIMAHYRWLLKGFQPAAMAYHRVRCFTDAQIDSIRDRVLYLVGEQDPFFLLGGRDALMRCGMHTVFYPDAGHGLNHELAETVNQRLIAYFLQEQEEKA